MNIRFSILWLDDNEVFLESLDWSSIKRTIQSWGFVPDVEALANPEQFMERAPFREYDLIVVDCKLEEYGQHGQNLSLYSVRCGLGDSAQQHAPDPSSARAAGIGIVASLAGSLIAAATSRAGTGVFEASHQRAGGINPPMAWLGLTRRAGGIVGTSRIGPLR